MHEFEDQAVELAVVAFEPLRFGSLAGPELQFDGALPALDSPVARFMSEDVLPAPRFECSHTRVVTWVELKLSVGCEECHFGFMGSRMVNEENIKAFGWASCLGPSSNL